MLLGFVGAAVGAVASAVLYKVTEPGVCCGQTEPEKKIINEESLLHPKAEGLCESISKATGLYLRVAGTMATCFGTTHSIYCLGTTCKVVVGSFCAGSVALLIGVTAAVVGAVLEQSSQSKKECRDYCCCLSLRNGIEEYHAFDDNSLNGSSQS